MITRAETLQKILAKLQSQRSRYQTLAALAVTAPQRARFSRLASRMQNRIQTINTLMTTLR